MERLISCEFNMDTACVELKFVDGSMISIDTIAVENEVADNMYQRSELDWLIYNKPLEYAQLVLGGELEEYVLEHTGLKVSNLYISQVKRKCGLKVGKNYNLPKSEDSRQLQCPPEKENAIQEAMKYFGMI